MYAFEYHRPGSVADAVSLLGSLEDARALAGGQTLIAAMKLRLSQVSDLVDLGGISELRGVRVEGGKVIIGALSKHVDVANSAEVMQHIPALAALAGMIGDRQVRAVGTIGGSLANNDPAADYPAAALGLGATIVTTNRQIVADDFFTGMYETALEPGELITEISFPIPAKAAYVKFPNPASRFALVGVFVSQAADGSVRVAVTGAGPSVFRVSDMEAALGSSFATTALDGVRVSAAELSSDLHADADYRAHLVEVIAKRAVAAALG